ncbi:hypothetical protein QSV34_06900 [Porticoccus sp. W117]|uniref:hypothetical protein n=1 Tax=Porticoccus sp. W117 TaxID=3054777 RepID=UPI002596597B|nr:hypothetical protein [Porticoccus sp. W117]MDM3871083.1 hypothetical protein [Porticoccus sp. W117]
MKYKNSKVLISALYFGIAFFPLMSIASGYWAYSEYTAGIGGNFFIFVIGSLFFGYLSYLGFKLLKYLHHEYTLTDEAIEISAGKRVEVHKWSSGMRVKESHALQLFWLYSADNRVIVMVDYMMPGYKEFSSFIALKVKA